MNLVDDSNLITIPSYIINKICQGKSRCPINIEIINYHYYIPSSSFLISLKSSKDVPIYLKNGVVNKRTIISGDEEHFIIDLKPDVSFGGKISVFFLNGQGEIYARKVLKSELSNITNFPDENNNEYMVSYRISNKGFYIIDIPYDEISNLNPCNVLLTVKGLSPGQHTKK